MSHPDFPDWLIRCGYSLTNARGIDPEFCDPRNGDFTLQKSSPLIGEAREIEFQLPNENHEPTRIKLENINDIGAYQGDHIVEGPKFVYYLEPKD